MGCLQSPHIAVTELGHIAYRKYWTQFSDMPGVMNLESVECARCENGFEPKAKIVNCNGELFCSGCFVCAQCFRPFPDGVFYEFEERKYCEHCFHVLYAPCCAKCGEFIIGRVIKAMQQTWHPECFTCEMCHKELADLGFIKNQGRALCHDCNAKVKAAGVGKYMCQKMSANYRRRASQVPGRILL